MKTTDVKMTRLSIPESEYLIIKKEMKNNTEKSFIEYLNRIKLQCQDLEDKVFHLSLKNKDLENQKKVSEEACLKAKNHSNFIAEELAQANKNLFEAKQSIKSKDAEIKDLKKNMEVLKENLESVSYHYDRLSCLENVLCRRIDDMKCWKGRILNIFGWELFQTPFKRPCKKSKK